MSSVNTKARHLEILAAAHALLEEQGVDVTEGTKLRPLAEILSDRVGCHYSTSRNAISKAIRQKRGQLELAAWGGAREGAGYLKGEPRKRQD